MVNNQFRFTLLFVPNVLYLTERPYTVASVGFTVNPVKRMGRPRLFDEDEVLSKAMELFWSRGYHATSMSDLVAATGLLKGSLYQAFGDKHALFIAALDRYLTCGVVDTQKFLQSFDSPKAAIRELVVRMSQEAAGVSGKRGCLAVGAALEMIPHDVETAERIRRFYESNQQAILGALKRAQSMGEISEGKDLPGLARALVAGILGMRVLGKTGPTARQTKQTAESLLRLLD